MGQTVHQALQVHHQALQVHRAVRLVVPLRAAARQAAVGGNVTKCVTGMERCVHFVRTKTRVGAMKMGNRVSVSTPVKTNKVMVVLYVIPPRAVHLQVLPAVRAPLVAVPQVLLPQAVLVVILRVHVMATPRDFGIVANLIVGGPVMCRTVLMRLKAVL